MRLSEKSKPKSWNTKVVYIISSNERSIFNASPITTI